MVASLLATGKIAVLLNSVPRPWMQCRWVLRQGEPISPYLFLVITDLLHRMVVHQEVGPLHLLIDDLHCAVIQYADDTLILVWTEEDQVQWLKQVLDSFAAATGLHINYHESTFVPLHVDDGHAAELVAKLGCPVASFPQTYPGLSFSTA
ncbi:uncharacterized protein [Setaria viridis]|uniref:uncharacterized protein n=1 Tax=Setaria viridis TaxID=4556 RepID=UPI003B3AE374